MRKKITRILLIDDDKPTNFYNKRIVEKHEDFDEVVVMDSAIRALTYFEAVSRGEEKKPDIVFLDINMPVMNGWEFLDEFAKIKETMLDGISIFMLTTSLDQEERKRAEQNDLVQGFYSKPLSGDVLDIIANKNLVNK